MLWKFFKEFKKNFLAFSIVFFIGYFLHSNKVELFIMLLISNIILSVRNLLLKKDD